MKNIFILLFFNWVVLNAQTLTFPKELNFCTTEDLQAIGSNEDGSFYFDWEKGRIVGVTSENKFISSQDKIWEKINFIEVPDSRTRWTVIDNYILLSYIHKNNNDPKLYCIYIDSKTLETSKANSKIISLNSSYKFGTPYAEFYNMFFVSSPDNSMSVLTLTAPGEERTFFLNLYKFTQEGINELDIENNISKLIHDDVKTFDDFVITKDYDIVFTASNYFYIEGLPMKTNKNEITMWLCKFNNKNDFTFNEIGNDFSKFTSLDYDNVSNTLAMIEYRYNRASKKEPYQNKTSGIFLTEIGIRIFNTDLSLIEDNILSTERISFTEDLEDEVIPYFIYTNERLCVLFKSGFYTKTVMSATGKTSSTVYVHTGFQLLFIDQNLEISSYKKIDAAVNGRTSLEYARFGYSYLFTNNSVVYLIANNKLRFFKDKYGSGEDESELVAYKINIKDESIEKETILSFPETGFITRLFSTNLFTHSVRGLNGNVSNIPLTFIKREKLTLVNELKDKKGDFYFGILNF